MVSEKNQKTKAQDGKTEQTASWAGLLDSVNCLEGAYWLPAEGLPLALLINNIKIQAVIPSRF